LTLVIGEQDEGYGIDKEGNITLYLQLGIPVKANADSGRKTNGVPERR
jgi:hypothetical protein